MRVRVDQPRGNESALAVVLVGERLHQLVRLLAVLATPHDLFSHEDHGGVFDDAGRSASEEATDVAEAVHFVTTVSPPTTTFVTSLPENP